MKEELSDFLKLAMKSGRIKEVEEAFNEFPPEEEWHKGKIMTYDEFCETKEAKEYALSEEEVKYYTTLSKKEKKYKVGDIVYVDNYKYKTGEIGNKHSFVIIEEGRIIDIDYFGFLVSSKLGKANFPYNNRINKNDINNLYKDSIVKCDDLIVISENNIKFKIGEVTGMELENFKEIYNTYKKELH